MEPVLALVGLVVSGVFAQWVASRLKIPAIVFLLGLGLVVGPITGLLRPDHFFGELLDPFVEIAVAVILFEGGLSLRWREARRLGWPLWSLVVVGLVVTFVTISLLGHYVAGLSWPTALTVGAILVVTGPTVIKPMLRQARLPQRPANLLKWEGIVNDPMGALLAVLVLEFTILEPAMRGVGEILVLAGYALAAAALGVLGGWLLARAFRRGWIPEHLKTLVALAEVLAVYALANEIGAETGLVAVTVMGITLANSRVESVEDVRRFKEEITVLLVSLLFIVLAARLDPGDLNELSGRGLVLILLVIFLVRPLAVYLATMRSGLSRGERILIGWVAPRGVVAAAVAGAFTAPLIAEGVEDAKLLTPIIFGVIISTVVLHGLTVRPLAKWLGMTAKRQGMLLVGASIWSADLMRALKEAGVDVVVADNRYRRISEARMGGLEVFYGDVLSEDTLDDLPMERVGLMLAASDDDAYNSLVCLRLLPLLGREAVLQLTPSKTEGAEVETHLRGRAPWGPGGSYDALTTRYWGGNHFKSTTLGDSYTWESFRDERPTALPLFAVNEKKLQVLDEDATPSKSATIIYLP